MWLPCEIEALAIGAAVSYFSPIIIQSVHRASIASDSKACVQAYDRMCRGLFSHSARVMTFLTTVCRYQVIIRHKAGKDIPFTDYASRHTVECVDGTCQVCTFVQELADQVVRRISVHEVLSGSARMPFANRQSWLASQRECPDLRKVFSFLSLGGRPRKKENKLRDVKTYLQKVVIAKDGLLVVRDILPFQLEGERIVVPKKFVQGLLTAIHLRFGHPSAHQLKQLVRRYFYAINLDKCAEDVSASCDTCNSLKFVPEELCVHSTSIPTAVGTMFAFDVLRRERQLIGILRESVTSYSVTSLMNSEDHVDHRNTILILAAELKGFASEIRVDPAPGLASLRGDAILKANGIVLDVGQEKNPNKNPIAERAVQELELEILKIQPDKGPVSAVTLALATAALNARIRRDGLSSRELWTQRDQITGRQFPVDDENVILNQNSSRLRNHIHSTQSKHHPSQYRNPATSNIEVGALVYLVAERSKLQARDKYLVTSIVGDSCKLRKFTRHQFRKKEYVVPLRAVYAIVSESTVPNIPPQESSDSDDDDYVVATNVEVDMEENGIQEVEQDNLPGATGEDVPRPSRPCRTRRDPDRFGDFVSDKDPDYHE